MSITIELAHDEEQTLRQQAELNGQDVETYLLRRAGLRWPVAPPLTDAQFERLLDELADTDAPLLSDYDVSREGIYRDHD